MAKRQHGMARKTTRTSTVQRKSSSSREHQPSNRKMKYTHPPAGATGAAANPKVRSISHTPSTTDTSGSSTVTRTATTKSSQSHGLPAPSGSAQLVMVLGIILIIFASYKDVVKPLAGSIWGGTKNSIQWVPVLGMLVMLFVMVMLASVSDDAAGLMVLLEVAMGMVMLVMNPSNIITGFFSWFSKSSTTTGSSTSGSQSSGTPPVTVPGKPPGTQNA